MRSGGRGGKDAPLTVLRSMRDKPGGVYSLEVTLCGERDTIERANKLDNL